MKYINNNTNTTLKSLRGLLLICVLSLFTPNSVTAQQQSVKSKISSEIPKKSGQLITIRGTVSEKELPLPDVRIVIDGYESSMAITDIDGNFEITFPKSLLKKGIVLQSSHPAFQTNTQEITSNDVKKKRPVVIDMVAVQKHDVIGCIDIKKR
ncbi:hypothetical protein [Flavobacterium cerinum]|uniref:Carboxypeptidase regulatory-like domain-containing protein n=1 Tax=Flavobacterium cerinum TaxID=2502784 RepID=A0ABY5IS37_9FLAO|nr:hypothetical protein [Flavobacterium cerinum]UUC44357.1 hypothetical protein NOX80_12010 [Flavobacterium cerinum]